MLKSDILVTMADGQDVPRTGKIKRRISSIPTTPGVTVSVTVVSLFDFCLILSNLRLRPPQPRSQGERPWERGCDHLPSATSFPKY